MIILTNKNLFSTFFVSSFFDNHQCLYHNNSIIAGGEEISVIDKNSIHEINDRRDAIVNSSSKSSYLYRKT